MYDIGCHAVEDLSNYFGLAHEHSLGVERAEFADVFEVLAGAGYPMVDIDAAWDAFCSMRDRYAGPLNALAANFVTPPIYALRAPLFEGRLPSGGDVAYLCVAAVVALVLGAFVFSRVDDRIAVEL